MKTKVCCLALAVFHALFAAASPVLADDLFVQVRSTKLRKEPGIWAGAVRDLSYGERLFKAGNKDGWFEVETSNGVKGYVHESAVTPRRVVLGKGNAQNLVETEDVVLAGKGFSREVENSLKSTDVSLNFSGVDAMERLRVGSEELRKFAAAGGLKDQP